MLARADHLLANASNDDQCLVRMVRAQAGWSAALSLTAAATTVLALAAGMFLITSEAMSKPDALSLALAQPVATLQIVAGLMLLAVLVLVPVQRMIAGMGGANIEIDGSLVRVAERGLFSSRSFNEPLEAYSGVAPRVRTTLSGLSHELVLVHPDTRRDVVIAVDRVEPASSPALIMQRLGLPEIAPDQIGRRR